MKSSMPLDDESVMSEVRAGDVARLEVLFDRHQPALVRYFVYVSGNRAVSEDLAQEAFFRILKYRHTYKPGANFRAWLYQIARNVYADHAGKHKIEVPMPEDPPETGSLLGHGNGRPGPEQSGRGRAIALF